MSFQKCSICFAEGFHEEDCSRKFAVSKTTVFANEQYDLGKIEADFKAERFPGSDLMDTSVSLSISDFCISWKDKESLINDLLEVIKKYQI